MNDPEPSKEHGRPSDPEEKLLDHNYDGIRELDNPLPAWWVWLFYLSILFSAVYFVYFTFFEKTAGERADLQVARILKAEQAEKAAASGQGSGAAGEGSGPGAFKDDDAARALGKKVYDGRCSVCHAPDGGGLIGPNMTDDHWIHGKGTLEDIYHTTVNGVPDKGMIPWGPVLSDEEIRAVAVYVRSLQGTTPAAPKAPQGEPV